MEDFEGKKEIINLFNKILGSKVSIKDNISKTEETLFTYFVNKLDESHNNEEELFPDLTDNNTSFLIVPNRS